MPNTPTPSPEGEGFSNKLVHLAIPVRWSFVGQQGRGPVELACTYDVHPKGARLLGTRDMTVGDMLTVERGRNKAVCQVIWSADPASALRGQFTVQCLEGRVPWDEELRQMEEQYQPLIEGGQERVEAARSFGRADGNRRRRPRFYVDGQAEVMDGAQRLAGAVEEMSEYGARLRDMGPLQPGTDFRLMLNVLDVSLALKAQVRYMSANVGMGVEFQEIRRGDRPLLSYVLGKLKTRRVEEFAPVEAVTKLPAAAE